MVDRKFLYRRIFEGIAKLLVFACFCFIIFHGTVKRISSVFPCYPVPEVPKEIFWSNWWNIDQPLHVQLATYLYNMFTFNFGNSFSGGFGPVIESIAVKAPYTIVLVGFAFAFVLFFRLLVQVGTGLCQWIRRRPSLGALRESVSGFSLLSYLAQILIILILLVFSNSVLLIINKTPIDSVFGFIIWLDFHMASSLISSIVFLSLALYTGILLLVHRIRFELRNSIFSLREQNNDEDVIFRKHVISRSIPCLGAMTSLLVGFLLGAIIVIEIFFHWPGLGRFFFESVIMKNYPVLNAIFFLTGLSTIIVQFNSEVLYGVMVPWISSWMRTSSH